MLYLLPVIHFRMESTIKIISDFREKGNMRQFEPLYFLMSPTQLKRNFARLEEVDTRKALALEEVGIKTDRKE